VIHSDQNIRIEKFRIRAFEIDTRGKLLVPALCNYMQEIAGNHAEQLGVGFEAMLKQKMIWILSRLYLQVEEYPRWGETISVETWPAVAEGKFALRDFLFHTAQDHLFARATTSWMVLDIQHRKPVSLPPVVHQIKRPVRERALIDPFTKFTPLARIDWERKFQVRLSDLDLNFHVNNVSYLKWSLDAIPLPIWKARQLQSLEINFRAESHIDELVLVQVQQSDLSDKIIFDQRLVRETDCRELAGVRTCWRL
jgi:medium-chain acyl-[acyl-carrier-protein] hydrolase